MGNPLVTSGDHAESVVESVVTLSPQDLKRYFTILFSEMSHQSKTAFVEIMWSQLTLEEQREIRLPFERTRLSEAWIDNALTSAFAPQSTSPSIQSRVLNVSDLLEFAFNRLSALSSPGTGGHGHLEGNHLFSIFGGSYRRADFHDTAVVVTSMEPGDGETDVRVNIA